MNFLTELFEREKVAMNTYFHKRLKQSKFKDLYKKINLLNDRKRDAVL